MPWTLYGYIFKDLLKQLSIVTAVVVVVLSIGVSIEPLSEGSLEAKSLLKIMAYSLPGMLPYALPFASVLAGTLVYARISSENEVTACRASGIGYRSFFLPACVLGLVVGSSVFVLSNWIVPVFWQKVERELGEDLVQYMVRKIQSGKTVSMGKGMVIYADRVDMAPAELSGEGPHPYNRLILEGVALGKMVHLKNNKSKTHQKGKAGEKEKANPKKKVVQEVKKTVPKRVLEESHTARRAIVEFYRDREQSRTFATMLLRDVSIQDRASNRFFAAEELAFNAIELPGLVQQKLTIMSLPDLNRLIQEPLRHDNVRAQYENLVRGVAMQVLLEAVAKAAKPDMPLILENPGGLTYELSAPTIKQEKHHLSFLASGNQPFQVLIKRQGRLTQSLQAQRGMLEPVFNPLQSEPKLNLRLLDVTVTATSLKDTKARKNERVEPMLVYPPASKLFSQELPISKLLEQSSAYPAEIMDPLRHEVIVHVERLRLEASSIIQSRIAVATSCLMVFLLGAVMSTLLRRQVPLVVFFWCFLPTILAFLSVHEGASMLQQYGISRAAGMGVLWSGNGLLLLLVLIGYRKLARQ